MRITGKGIRGPPEDRPETLRILKRVPELGIVHQHRRLYGPDVSKELIRDALYELAKSGSILDRIAKAHGAAPSQIGLAWVLRPNPGMLPIPGTSKVSTSRRTSRSRHSLSDEEHAALDREGRAEYAAT